MPRSIPCFLIAFFLPLVLLAQVEDTSSVRKTENHTQQKITRISDSVYRFNTTQPIPKRAALYSALLPGLGQVYNKQYWKTGIVAATAGAITYFIVSNRQEYLKYQKDHIYRIDGNPATVTAFPQYADADIDLLRNGFRRYYEYSVIAASVCYLLNILDAFTSAHLRTFDMSKDISWKWKPVQQNQPIGVALSFTLNKK
jgi:hypothetical protein